jgi:hypothetical protein
VTATTDGTAGDGAGPEGAAETGTAEAASEGGVPCNPLGTPDPATGVFVNGASGSDTTGTGSVAAPYRSIGKGMLAAAAASMAHVYVAPGTYAESLTFPVSATGTLVEGGWAVSASNAWTTDCNAGPSGRTVLQGSTTAVSAVGLTAASGISTMTIQTSADVSTSSPGTSLVGVLVAAASAPFSLTDVDVVAGIAGDGAVPPATAPVTATVCGTCTDPPAMGTTPAAGAPASTQGTFTSTGFTPTDGQNGSAGGAGTTGKPALAGQTVTYNASCTGGCFSACGTATAQTTGATGVCGCGGFGGNPGAAGHGGGASVAVLVYGTGTSVDVSRSTLASGKGGAGSAGASGGAPAPGTAGFTGTQSCVSSVTCGVIIANCIGGTFAPCGQTAPPQSVCAQGSTGGAGASGGQGSAGGGGAGGPSYAVVTAAGATVSLDGASVLTALAGGAGAGGAPAGTAAPHGAF